MGRENDNEKKEAADPTLAPWLLRRMDPQRDAAEILNNIPRPEWRATHVKALKVALVIMKNASDAEDARQIGYEKLLDGQCWDPYKGKPFMVHTVGVVRGVCSAMKESRLIATGYEETAMGEREMYRDHGVHSPEERLIRKEAFEEERSLATDVQEKLTAAGSDVGLRVLEAMAQGHELPAEQAAFLGEDIEEVRAARRLIQGYVDAINERERAKTKEKK